MAARQGLESCNRLFAIERYLEEGGPRRNAARPGWSVATTTNLEFEQWNTVINDSRLTAALVDGLVHHGRVLAFTGESYRLRHALSQLNTPDDVGGIHLQQDTFHRNELAR